MGGRGKARGNRGTLCLPAELVGCFLSQGKEDELFDGFLQCGRDKKRISIVPQNIKRLSELKTKRKEWKATRRLALPAFPFIFWGVIDGDAGRSRKDGKECT